MVKYKDNYFIFFHNKTYYGWVIVTIASICMMFSYGARYTFSVFFKPMLEEFGWSRAITSSVFSLYMITYAVGSVITGKIVDKYGPKFLIIIGALILGIGIYCCSIVTKIYQLYIFYGILVGLGGAATGWVNATTTIARWFVKKRGLATGITSTGVGLGSAIFIPFATFLVATLGWRLSFQLFGIVTILILVPLGFFTIKSPKVKKEYKKSYKIIDDNKLPNDKKSLHLGEAVKTIPYWAMMATQFLMTLQLNVIMVHFIPYATDIGISPLIASRDVASISLVSVLGRIYGGWFADRVGRKKIVTIAMIIQAISCLFLPFIKSNIVLYTFIYMYGISYGAWVSQSPPFAAGIFGNKNFGALWGVITLGIGLGGAVGPLIAGWIHDITGSYILIFSINILINLLSTLLTIFFVKPLMPILKNT